MSIYDRAAWPSPEANPIILLLTRGDAWFSNREILASLGYNDSKKSLVSQWPTLIEQIGEAETVIERLGWMTPANEPQPQGGGQERYFSAKAVAIIAMRAQTANAAAFRDWAAVRASTEVA